MIAAFIIAGVLVTLLTPAVLRVSHRYGFYDATDGPRRLHRRPIPRLGGAAVFGAVAGTLLLLNLGLPGLSPDALALPAGVVAGGMLIFAVGLADDLYTLRPWVKLGFQVAAALLVFSAGVRVDLLTLSPGSSVSVGVWALPLTLAWIVGVTNAVNLIDGLDGLATGIAMVALGTILAMAAFLGSTDVVVVCSVLLGALLGFLRFNFRPARIFLGDSGSLFIGFSVAVLALQGSVKAATAAVVLVPVFALAVPLLDVSLAIGRRWLRGTPVFGADERHIHHRLLARGLDHGHAAIVLYVVAGCIAILGLSLAFAPPDTIVLIAALGGAGTLALFVYGLRKLEYTEFSEAGSVLASGVGRVRRVIRDQICAKDAAARLRLCASLTEMNEVLSAQAAQFGFLAVEIVQGPEAHDPNAWHIRRAWKLDYPLRTDGAPGELYTLRIWCGLDNGKRPYGAERVAQILGPVIDGTLRSLAQEPAAPAPAAVPVMRARPAAVPRRIATIEPRTGTAGQ